MNALRILAVLLLLAACGSRQGPEPQTLDEHAEEHAGEAHHEEGHGEGALHLTEQQVSNAGIDVARAGPATIREQLSLYGTIVPNAERVRQVAARFPGVIQSVTRRVGDAVKQGERLATIESNESLKSYAVVSPLAGVVTQRAANEGEQAGSAPLFTVTDLASVWAEIALFPRDVSKVRVGQPVLVSAADGQASTTGRIVYLAPLGSSVNQTITGRVLLDNADGRWAPGLFVSAAVIINEAAAVVTVRNTALQTLDNEPVVFVRTEEGFEPRSVRLGRRDAEVSEILSGLAGGERYAASNSFVLKAEAGKGEAGHDH